MSQPLLAVDRVVKRFATVDAVSEVSFRVEEGEIFALLGPNGAGKTTLVRMLIGMTRPDAGTIRFGPSVTAPGRQAESIDRRLLGYLPEERGLYADRPVVTTLAYFAALRGVPRARAEKSAMEWLDRLGLSDRATHKIETLSKGNQQRVQIIAAILHRPALAVLDEPFSGLDPIHQETIVDLIQELRSQGMTVLLSAHQMDLVERLAGRVLLLNRGRELVSGSVADLRGRFQGRPSVRLEFAGEPPLDELRSHPSIAEVAVDGEGGVTLLPRSEDDLSAAVAHAASVARIRTVHSDRPRLHDIYVRAVREHERDRAMAEAR